MKKKDDRTTKTWLSNFNHNPLIPLLNYGNEAIATFVKRDLLNENVLISDLWKLTTPQYTVKKQLPNGSWEYPENKKSAFLQKCFNQYETFKKLSILVEMYGFNKKHPAIAKAAEYLFSVQTDEGDFRGIYGNQYSPNFSAAIAELLIKAGYENDIRIENFFKWILSIKQNDGGWAMPLRTKGYGINVIYVDSHTIIPDLSKPFSYMVTGVVLRAFSAHPKYRKTQEAHHAGNLLLSTIFKKDNYPDRSDTAYWLRFAFPFDYTHLISALDSLSLLDFSIKKPQIQKALQWFIDNQRQDGLWDFRIVRGTKKDNIDLWLALAVCRIFKRFYKDQEKEKQNMKYNIDLSKMDVQ